MQLSGVATVPQQVALLVEGVDRNLLCPVSGVVDAKVALLAEGVDRNQIGRGVKIMTERRPPRGGRG